jgi:hypothetical protein
VYFLNPFMPFVGNPFLPSENRYYVAMKPPPDKDFFNLATFLKCDAGKGWRRSVGPIM